MEERGGLARIARVDRTTGVFNQWTELGARPALWPTRRKTRQVAIYPINLHEKTELEANCLVAENMTHHCTACSSKRSVSLWGACSAHVLLASPDWC